MEPRVIDIPIHVDDRGSVYGVLDDLIEKGIQRTYVIRNWQPGTIRAWHGHLQAGTYIHPIKGTAKIVALRIEPKPAGGIDLRGDMRLAPQKTFSATLSAAKPQLFYIPPGWYNGTMTLQEDTRLLCYSTLTLSEVKDDDVRKGLTEEEKYRLWNVRDR